ncbi:MAG: SDR family oxidoreductase [Nannocystaceae bacterium]|nr:SDR family oxidoreductase [Myxococcales bacterium]
MSDSSNVIITGCSSGFGLIFAKTLAGAGHRVFATMRDVAGKNAAVAAELTAWAEAEGRALSVLELDVTDDASVAAAIGAALEQAGAIDVLVNNAGVAGLGLLEGYTPDMLRRLFEVNVFGAHRVCRAVLPSMRARGRGLLAFVSSSMGRVVVPCVGAYAATKFALECLAETYAYELAPIGVEVSILEPGTHPTAIGANMAAWSPDDPERLAQDYGRGSELPGRIGGNIVAVLSAETPPDSQRVGDALLQVVSAPEGRRPRRVVIDELGGQGVEAINQAATAVQGLTITSLGLGDILGDDAAAD